MRIVVTSLSAALLSVASLVAQTPPPQTPPPKPPPTTQTPATAPKPRPAAPAQAGPMTMTVTVTDSTGQTIADASVTASGPLDRSGSTDSNGIVRFQGVRVGTYRLRVDAENFVSLEREVVTRAGVRTYDVPMQLNEAPKPEPPPPPPPPPKPTGPVMPPPGSPKTMSLVDWLQNNPISNREPQKESIVGCSGLSQALMWQVRDAWNNRQHDAADGMLYVVGGEGTLHLGDRDSQISAGSFAVVPRGTSYSLTRRGRSPLFVLAVLAGAPCTAQ